MYEFWLMQVLPNTGDRVEFEHTTFFLLSYCLAIALQTVLSIR